MCDYCPWPIDKDSPGWGYFIHPEGYLVYFHCECIEYETEAITEDIWSLENI